MKSSIWGIFCWFRISDCGHLLHSCSIPIFSMKLCVVILSLSENRTKLEFFFKRNNIIWNSNQWNVQQMKTDLISNKYSTERWIFLSSLFAELQSNVTDWIVQNINEIDGVQWEKKNNNLKLIYKSKWKNCSYFCTSFEINQHIEWYVFSSTCKCREKWKGRNIAKEINK